MYKLFPEKSRPQRTYPESAASSDCDDGRKTCNLSQGINLKDKQDKFAGYLDFLSPNKKGVKLTIDFGQKVASKANVKAVSGAYALVVNEKESPSRDLTNAVLSTAYKP